VALFFGKKKDGEARPATAPGTPPPASSTPGGPGPDAPPAAEIAGQFTPAPEKARRFFDHAKTVDEATNYEYAMQSWLNGLRFEPDSMTGVPGFFSSASKFLAETGGKKPPTKELSKSVSGKGDLDRYLLSLLEWAMRPTDPPLAVRAMESSAKLGLQETTYWIGERAFATVLRDKKVRKDLLIKVSDSFGKIGAWDKAVAAAEQALKVDPADGELGAQIRSMAAQATMSRGGYDKTGEQGGFRRNIRDADKQRMLEEQERVSKTDGTVDRLIAAATEEYQKRPGDLPTVDRYAKLLLERARPDDEEKAHALYAEAHAQTKQFRFRELAGEIRIRQSKRKLAELRRMLDAAPGDETVGRMHAQATQEHLELELGEFKLRVQAYPTDISRKFELGKRHFALGNHNEAIEFFQEAQADPRNRASALNYLGQSFLKIRWNDEAVDAFRRALEIRELSPEVQIEIRYGLMAALQEKAAEARDLAAAEESDRIASSIAVQQIGFRDIRLRRDSIKKLLAELRAPRPS